MQSHYLLLSLHCIIKHWSIKLRRDDLHEDKSILSGSQGWLASAFQEVSNCDLLSQEKPLFGSQAVFLGYVDRLFSLMLGLVFFPSELLCCFASTIVCSGSEPATHISTDIKMQIKVSMEGGKLPLLGKLCTYIIVFFSFFFPLIS